MNTVNIAIIEDDTEDFRRLKSCLEQFFQNIDRQYSITPFTKGEDFLCYPDSFHLVFMDIELPGINGIETAQQLRSRHREDVLVLVTNMVQYAIHGYSVNAVDYIVKPVMYEQLALKMPGFLSMLKRKQKHLVIRQKQDVTKLNIKDIRFIEIFRHDVIIHTDKGDVSCYGTLKEFEDDLSDYGFVKCSQSCLINLAYVQSISGDQILVDGCNVPVSRREKKKFLDAFIRYEKE